jgi:hypothetical protein
MARKYYSGWVNAEGDECRLDFYFASYSGAATELSSGMRAFVLKEFNSDNDFYKPIRPQQAEFEILADGVTLESFLFNNDNEVSIQFLWNGSVYWRGWLIQDDFEESWVDSKHFITLRATEQLSGLNIIAPTLPVGHSTPFDFIINALANTSIANGLFCDTNIINNLFYETMTDKDVDDAATCLNQMFISNATFQKTLTTFDDYQTILEKINTSFNQTIFQYNGDAYLVRMSEFLTYPASLPGVEYQPFNVFFPFTATNESYLAYIGIDEDIKPIMPEMLRQVVRPYKKFQIDYKYEFPPEIVPNSSFKKGAFSFEETQNKFYLVENWLKYYGSRDTPTLSSEPLYRQEVYDDDGVLVDNALSVKYITGQSNTFAKSESIRIIKNEKINFKISIAENLGANEIKKVLQILYVTDAGAKYGLQLDGLWILSPSGWDNAAIPFIEVELEFQDSIDFNYTNFSLTSNAVPENGYLHFIFYNNNPAATPFRWYKDFNFNLISKINGVYSGGIIGDYDRYTKTEDIKQNLQLQSTLDDGDSFYWKGTIFSPDNVLTADNWYRMQYQSESFTFKREKAIAHWLLNRRYRQLITGNFYGLTWESSERVIGLMNRFIFTDDAPTKQFMIVNLQEIDFVSCQWKATLIETYDSTIDTSFTDYPPHSFDFLYSE